jgi:hypothetical protein
VVVFGIIDVRMGVEMFGITIDVSSHIQLDGFIGVEKWLEWLARKMIGKWTG